MNAPRYARHFEHAGHDVHIDAGGQFIVLKIRNGAGELVNKTRYMAGDYSAAKIKQDARAIIAGINKGGAA